MGQVVEGEWRYLNGHDDEVREVSVRQPKKKIPPE